MIISNVVRIRIVYVYSFNFKDQLKRWIDELNIVNEILKDWLAIQTQWLTLRALFQNSDISESLPQATKLFSNVSKIWARLMKTAGNNSNIFALCGVQGTVEKILPFAKIEADNCLKAINLYLLKKRLEFPQLFFVSDNTILHLISCNLSTIPSSELTLLFNGMKSIDLDQALEKEDNPCIIISSISSKNDEITKIPLHLQHYSKQSSSIFQNLAALSYILTLTLYEQIYDGILDFGFWKDQTDKNNALESLKVQSTDMVFDVNFLNKDEVNTMQTILVALKLLWTYQCEAILNMSSKADTKKSQFYKFVANIDKIIGKYITHHTVNGNRLLNAKREVLLLAHLHHRDVLIEMCNGEGSFYTETSFEW